MPTECRAGPDVGVVVQQGNISGTDWPWQPAFNTFMGASCRCHCCRYFTEPFDPLSATGPLAARSGSASRSSRHQRRPDGSPLAEEVSGGVRISSGQVEGAARTWHHVTRS